MLLNSSGVERNLGSTVYGLNRNSNQEDEIFFDQIKEVEKRIKQLQKDLVAIGEGVEGHYDQLDDIAAHIIELEAIMIEVMKKTEIDVDAVKAWIVAATEGSTGKEGGSTKTQVIVENLISSDPAPEKRD